MNVSQCFPSSRIAVASPNGTLIATVHQSRLILRSSTTGDICQNFQLPQDFPEKCRYVRWYKGYSFKTTVPEIQHKGKTERVLLANDDTVLIYSAKDAQWKAEITGASSNLGSIANIDFGYTPDEVLVFSDFRVKVTIWSLITNRGVEIRDPKTIVNGYDYRLQSGHLAVLTRAAAHDTVMLLDPGSYDLSKNFDLPTVEAQGLKWSTDGRWLAIWDAASSGYKVLIYTADGHLFKTYMGGQDAHNIGLGVKSLSWGPTAGLLAIGDYNGHVTLLNTNTLSLTVVFEHLQPISLFQGTVWQEQINAAKERSYVSAPQPACPPTQASTSAAETLRIGISLMEFNSQGDFLATRSDSIPSTIWIWSVKSSAAVTVMMHHSPVKKIQWHPTIGDLLLMHCAVNEPVVHLWKSTWEMPQVIHLQLVNSEGRMEVCWLHSEIKDAASLMLSSLQNYTTAHVMSNGQGILQPLKAKSFGVGPEDMFDEGNSFNLSPIKISADGALTNSLEGSSGHDQTGQWNLSEDVDDTFHYKRHDRHLV